MKDMIRWKGLIAFVAVIALGTVLWLFFVDGFVERMIEKTGTWIVGAKVELDDANLSLFPLGLNLRRLQVTDPEKPMTNTVEIKRTVLSLDSLNLLRRKVIIERMAMEGVRFGTERKTSGAPARKPADDEYGLRRPGKKEPRFKLPTFKIPDVNEILKREELESLKLTVSLRKEVQDQKKSWQKRLEGLPDKKDFDDYEKRIEGLRSVKKIDASRLLGIAGELKSIRADITNDLDNIKSTRKEFDALLNSLKMRADQAAKAPIEDINRLKLKYSLQGQGVSNITQLLFGPKVSNWVEAGLVWYERLRPVIERTRQIQEGSEGEEEPDIVKPIRAKGVDVRFKEKKPLPDFMIKMANTSLQIKAGDIKGKVKNITPDQDVLGIPLTFVFSGENLKEAGSVTLEGELNHIVPSKPNDKANLRIRGYNIENLALSESKELPIVLKEALADLKLNVSRRGEVISANVLTRFYSAQLLSPKEGESPLINAVHSSLSAIKSLDINIDISGTLKDYHIRLSSDIDRILKNVIGKELKEQTIRFEKELKEAISEKVKGPLSALQTEIGAFAGINSEITSRLDEGNRLLGDIKGGLPGGLKSLF
ncbi:MAG: TIGR03545 family protein [Thermodesulfobacteriota bacterium]|nr:TIGR03545 family protein [Thermodesulfobacteriota bacterium]